MSWLLKTQIDLLKRIKSTTNPDCNSFLYDAFVNGDGSTSLFLYNLIIINFIGNIITNQHNKCLKDLFSKPGFQQ